MVKATDVIVEKYIDDVRVVRVSLVADTKNEVIDLENSGEGVENLQDDDILAFGSSALCVNGDFGMLTSAGHWQF